jgi:hypothetical protein
MSTQHLIKLKKKSDILRAKNRLTTAHNKKKIDSLILTKLCNKLTSKCTQDKSELPVKNW